MPTLSLPNYHIQLGPIQANWVQTLKQRQYQGYAILVDEHTEAHCLPRLLPFFEDQVPTIIRIPSGELNKNLTSCQRIWEALFTARAGRNWCVLNLGGGVIGDMGGFCASTFKRGIDFLQIPTTLLSQVDASVGGKLGIDFAGVKNSIGLFRDPIGVWVDPAFLTTLPERELRSGFAEMIKHALIDDAEHWNQLLELSNLQAVDWVAHISRSVQVKQRIVVADPLEKDLRKALNFGHTIGHAVESFFLETTNPLLHGEAIAVGMIAESWLSQQQSTLAAAELDTITDFVLSVYGHCPIPKTAYPDLLATMAQDKKNESTAINFSLLRGIGKVIVNQTATTDRIIASLDYYNSLTEVVSLN